MTPDEFDTMHCEYCGRPSNYKGWAWMEKDGELWHQGCAYHAYAYLNEALGDNEKQAAVEHWDKPLTHI